MLASERAYPSANQRRGQGNLHTHLMLNGLGKMTKLRQSVAALRKLVTAGHIICRCERTHVGKGRFNSGRRLPGTESLTSDGCERTETLYQGQNAGHAKVPAHGESHNGPIRAEQGDLGRGFVSQGIATPRRESSGQTRRNPPQRKPGIRKTTGR